MFDDQKSPNPNNQPAGAISMADIKPAGPRPVPSNLPNLAEPTVMPKLASLSGNLSELKPMDSVAIPVNKPAPAGLELPDLPKVNRAQDMFEETEATPFLEAVQPGAMPPTPGPLKPLSALPDDLDADHDGGGKKTWLIIAIVVIVLGIGGYYAYSRFFSGLAGKAPIINSNNSAPADLNSNKEEGAINENQNQAQMPEEPAEANVNINTDCPQLTPPGPDFCINGEIVPTEDANGCPLPPDCIIAKSGKDSDKDGLTDTEEESYGTDPFEPDSDGDNLFDREEVKVWHTNPLNPDSDSDGYLDGDEVESGYNPLGPGKLLDLNFEE